MNAFQTGSPIYQAECYFTVHHKPNILLCITSLIFQAEHYFTIHHKPIILDLGRPHQLLIVKDLIQ